MTVYYALQIEIAELAQAAIPDGEVVIVAYFDGEGALGREASPAMRRSKARL